jgi:hypothetical protein
MLLRKNINTKKIMADTTRLIVKTVSKDRGQTSVYCQICFILKLDFFFRLSNVLSSIGFLIFNDIKNRNNNIVVTNVEANKITDNDIYNTFSSKKLSNSLISLLLRNNEILRLFKNIGLLPVGKSLPIGSPVSLNPSKLKE